MSENPFANGAKSLCFTNRQKMTALFLACFGFAMQSPKTGSMRSSRK